MAHVGMPRPDAMQLSKAELLNTLLRVDRPSRSTAARHPRRVIASPTIPKGFQRIAGGERSDTTGQRSYSATFPAGNAAASPLGAAGIPAGYRGLGAWSSVVFAPLDHRLFAGIPSG